MAKRKRKTELQDATAIVLGFANLVDVLFVRYTGKTMRTLLTESAQRPRELPGEKQTISQQEPAMPLVDAYAVLGLPQTATLEEVKRNYKNLAAVFHPDKGGYQEAMVLLNRAFEQIMSQKRRVR